MRIETASSAGFAGAFVDHLVETKGVSDLFFCDTTNHSLIMFSFFFGWVDGLV